MKSASEIGYYYFDGITLDVKNREIAVNDKPIVITSKSYDILLYLVENPGRVIRKKELIEKCWDEDYVQEAALVQHIYRITSALRNAGGNESCIETISGIGYKFVSRVERQRVGEMRLSAAPLAGKTPRDVRQKAAPTNGSKTPSLNSGAKGAKGENVECLKIREIANAVCVFRLLKFVHKKLPKNWHI